MFRRKSHKLPAPSIPELGALADTVVDDLYAASGTVRAQENQFALQATRDNYVHSVFDAETLPPANSSTLERRSYVATVYNLAGLAVESVIAQVPPRTLDEHESSLLLVNILGGNIMEREAGFRLVAYDQTFQELTNGSLQLAQRYMHDRSMQDFMAAVNDYAAEIAAHAMIKFAQPFSGDEAIRGNMARVISHGFDMALQTEELMAHQELQYYHSQQAGSN